MRNLSRQILCIAAALSGLALSGCPLGPPISVECRAKDGKVDLLWTAMDGAASYRLLRGVGGAQRTPIGDATGVAFVDESVTNGNDYTYAVAALDAGGQELASSGTCSATPAEGAGRDVPPGPAAVTGVACRAKDGKVDLSWKPAAGAISYRVTRSSGGADAITAGQSAAEAFADFQAPVGTALQYRVIPIGIDAEGSPSDLCSVAASSVQGPPAPSGVACRAKDGKVDLTWDAVTGAQSYRVFRTQSGQSRIQIAETAGRVHADLALANGTTYGYDVVTLDARGRASEASAICDATPGPRVGSGPPPAPVSDLACRGKNDKADLTWTAVQGASLYRVFRSDADTAATLVGETTGAVFADFGLILGKSYAWSLESVGPGGATSARSTVCSVTASGRISGAANQPPRFTSQPLTAALEQHFYYYGAVAVDPEADPISYAVDSGPGGLVIDATSGLLSWTPTASQIGLHPVQLRATDARGGFTTQAFLIEVADYNEPPTIVSIPSLHARTGRVYEYDVDAFDPEGQPLTFAFGGAVPEGMTIDSATGVVHWTPAVTEAGSPRVEVHAIDPMNAFAKQFFELSVVSETLDLLEPSGDRVIHPGETIRLRLVANDPRAGFRLTPKPDNVTLEKGMFEFKPSANQEGVFDFGFEAVLGDQRDLNPVRITVTRTNAPPVLVPVGTQTVKEGETLRVAITATDVDGDAIQFSAPSLSLPNAFFDELTHTLTFAPSFDQSGSYAVSIAASDARATVTTSFTIQVEESAPPVESLDLVVDPNQSPTLSPSVRIKGNVNGKPGSPEAATFALINGVVPVSVRQGRRVAVELTARDVAFVAGDVSADFGAGITVESVEVLSPTKLRASVVAAPDADLGVRTIRALAAGKEVVSVVAFSVEKGAAEVSGVLVDSFTGAPLVNARVSISGTSVVGVTDAQGRFTLSGAPGGDVELVVTAANYEVSKLPLSLQSNQTLNFDDKIQLNALARTFSAGGSLPRKPNAASLLDRGMASKDGANLDRGKARAIVQDTMLALGRDDVGLVDDAGNQLNPNFRGFGFLSLTPTGVDRVADLLLRGEIYTLQEIAEILIGSFGWLFGGDLNFERLRFDLQVAADRAWANPGDPDNTLALLLLNEGTTLDPKPPLISGETRFNRFQTFLYLVAFVRVNFLELNAAIDDLLARQGIDPSDTLRQLGVDPELAWNGPTTSDAIRSIAATGRLAAKLALEHLMPGAAFAATGVQPGASSSVKVTTLRNRGWNVITTIPSAFGSAVIAGIVAVLFAAFVAMLALVIGASLGLIGITVLLPTSIAVGTIFGGCAVSAFVAKLCLAFFADPQAQAHLTPAKGQFVQQAVTQEVDAATGQKKVRIAFVRSPTDVNNEQVILKSAPYGKGLFNTLIDLGAGQLNDTVDLYRGRIDPKYLDYRYHLWKFQDAKDPDFGHGRLISTRVQPAARRAKDPNKKISTANPVLMDSVTEKLFEFIIDDNRDNIGPGNNYYRVVTIQFYRKMNIFDPTFDPDIPQRGLSNLEKDEVNRAMAISYSDILGKKDPLVKQLSDSALKNARGEILEESSEIFGKFLNFLPDATVGQMLEDKIGRARLMREKVRDASLVEEELQGLRAKSAMGGASRAKLLDEGREAIEQRVKEQIARLRVTEAGRAGLELHQSVLSKLDDYLFQDANLAKTRQQVIAEVLDPNSAIGRKVSQELLAAGPEARAGVQEALGLIYDTERLREVFARQKDTLSRVAAAKAELHLAILEAERTGQAVAIKRTSVQRLIGTGADVTRLDVPLPEPIKLPTSVGPGDAAIVDALRVDLEAQRAELFQAVKSSREALPALKSAEQSALTRMRAAFMKLDLPSVSAARSELFKLYAEHKTILQEKRAIETNGVRLKEFEELAEQVEKRSFERPAAVPVKNLEKAGTLLFVEREGVLQSSFSARTALGKVLAHGVGPAVDIFSEAQQARDGLTVLRSEPSEPITITRDGNGKVVAPPTIRAASLSHGAGSGATLVATQPRLIGPVRPDGLDDDQFASVTPIPSIAFGAGSLGSGAKLPIFDTGQAVLEGPLARLRADRRLALLKRIGSAFRTVQFSDSTGFPLPFESDPDPDSYLGVLRPSEPQDPGGKGGYLVRDFPFSDLDAELIDAGFPSELIAVDSSGRVYLENKNSNEQYGGRIFRYAGDPVAREHMGAVTYYSLNIQYGRPTQPRTMEIAEGVTEAYGKVEDLFVAELDPGIYINESIKPTNRILRIPIHQADRIPFYANGQNRNRLVGQPYAEHPEFQMTGPSDLERDTVPRSPDPGVPLPLYFSDEENLFVIQDLNKDGQGEVSKIVSLAGRRFSGIALDYNGNLYFADFANGEIFLLPRSELDIILIHNRPIATEEELQTRAFLLKVNLQQPGDIELDTWQHRYLVATREGILPFNIPIMGRLDPNTTEIHVDIIGREADVTRRLDRGNIFIANTASEGAFGNEARFRVRKRDPVTGEADWSTSTVTTNAFGASILPDPL